MPEDKKDEKPEEKKEEKPAKKAEAAAPAPGAGGAAAAAAAAAGVAKKRKVPKGRHLSAFKRQRQTIRRTARNRFALSTLKSAVKKVRKAVVGKDTTLIQTTLKEAMSLFHKAASKGIIHHRNASRHIARLSKLVHRSETRSNAPQ